MTTNRRKRASFLLAMAAVAVLAAGCSGSSPSASLAPSAAAAANPSPVTGEVPIPDALIGSWTTTITEADLRAAGLTATGELGENAGVFTMTMDRDGTWTTSQEADVAVRWPIFRGTYVATGPSSFQQTTEFPADFAGDVVDFEWSIADGVLLLQVPNPPDPVLPVIMETHPWQPKG